MSTQAAWIVDAHHQFFDPSRQSSTQYPGGQSALPADLSAPLREQGIAQTVLIQPEPSLSATEWALALAASTEFVGATAAWVDVTADDIEETMDRLCGEPKLRGVCLSLQGEPDNHWLLRDDVARGLRLVAERGMSLDLLVQPRQIPSVGALAARVPGLHIALGHMGAPFIAKGQREPWGVHMLNLAPHANVVVKVSGLVGLNAQSAWHVAHFRPFVEAVVRLFGHERLLFGSDWPLHLPVAGYAEVVDAAVASAGPMTDGQRERLLGGTAREFYRLG